MSSTAKTTDLPVDYAPLATEEAAKGIPYNTRQKAQKLVRQIQHKHNYGVSIYAQQRMKVDQLQAELEALGLPKVELMQPDFNNPDLLPGYAELSNYKAQ